MLTACIWRLQICPVRPRNSENYLTVWVLPEKWAEPNRWITLTQPCIAQLSWNLSGWCTIGIKIKADSNWRNGRSQVANDNAMLIATPFLVVFTASEYYKLWLEVTLRPADVSRQDFLFYLWTSFAIHGLSSETMQRRPVKSISVVRS